MPLLRLHFFIWPAMSACMFDLFQLSGPAKARRIVVAMSGGVDSSVVAVGVQNR